jgi:hypothetical protein
MIEAQLQNALLFHQRGDEHAAAALLSMQERTRA